MTIRQTAIGSVLVLVAVIFSASCGGSGGGSAEAEIEETIKTYMTALATGDGEEACGQLTGTEARSFPSEAAAYLPELQPTSCRDVIKKLSGSLGGPEKETLESVEVDTIKVKGSSARATIVGGTTAAQLTKEGDRWFISGGLGLAP